MPHQNVFEAVGQVIAEVRDEIRQEYGADIEARFEQNDDALDALRSELNTFIQQCVGKFAPRELAEPVDALARQYKELVDNIPQVKDGADGEPGRDGQDRPLIDPVELKDGRGYPKNTVGTYAGGLWISRKDTVDGPDADPHAWHCILDAQQDISVSLTEDHTYCLKSRLSTGRVIETHFEIPFPQHKGIFEEGTTYRPGQIVTKGSAMFQAIEETDHAPPGNGWQMILVAPRGKQGPRGKGDPGPAGPVGPAGEIGPAGPQGKPGRNGRDGKDADLDWELVKAFIDNANDEPREASYPIRSFRGFFNPEESYLRGDVVIDGRTLYLFEEGGQWERWRDAAESVITLFSAPQNTIPPFMDWKGEYQPGQTYGIGQVVRDGAWTMVATTKTSDRAAPVPAGPAETTLPTTPTWDVDGSNASVVYSGHLYTFTESGWIGGLRVWVPELLPDTNYRFVVVADPFGNPRTEVIEEPVLNDNSWTTIALSETLVVPGTQYLVYIDALNSGSSTPTIGGWSYTGADNNVPPVAQAWNHTTQEDLLRVNKTDLNNNDRGTELLGITANSTVRFSDSTEPAIFKEYRVNGDPIDGGTFVSWPVTLVNSNGILPLGATDMDASTPIPQPTKYKSLSSHWGPGNLPSWAGIQGFLQYNGVDQPGNDDTAFGIDIAFTEAAISPDWDVVSTSASVGAGDTAAGGGVAGINVSAAQVTTTDNNWTEIQRRLVPDGRGYSGDLRLDAKRSDATGYYTANVHALAFNDSGVNTQDVTVSQLGDTALSVRTRADGLQVVIEVRGAAMQTWEWDLIETYREVD